MELAGIQGAGADAVVFGQCRQHHRANGHIDAHPEGVGTANDLEQARLGQLFDQATIFGQHTGVVDADPVADQTVQRLAEARSETEPGNQFGDPVLLLAGANIDAHQRLGSLDGFELAEVHHIDGSLLGGQQFLHGLLNRLLGVVVVQGDGALGVGYRGGVPAGTLGQFVFETGDVAQGRGHEQELRLGQLEQRDLPGPTALRVGVEVELVHHHRAQIGVGPFAQGDVGEDLRGAADDRCVLVH